MPSYDLLKQMVQSLSKYESAAKMMRNGDHETVGIIPVGAVYLFVRDRSLDSVQELAGKRIATMDYDKASPFMVKRIGAIVVPADLEVSVPSLITAMSMPATFRRRPMSRSRFGVGWSPMAAYSVCRSHKPHFSSSCAPSVSLPILARSHAHFASNFDRALGLVKKAEANIPGKYWIDMPADSLPGFEELFLGVRLELRDKIQAYDGRMLNVLRKLRCAKDRTRAECVEQKK